MRVMGVRPARNAGAADHGCARGHAVRAGVGSALIAPVPVWLTGCVVSTAGIAASTADEELTVAAQVVASREPAAKRGRGR